MSLMDSIRKGTDNTLMKAFFGLITFLFIFWGVNSGSTGTEDGLVAEVNGTQIRGSELTRAMRSAMRDQELDEAGQKKLRKEVSDRLIEKQVLLSEAERLGLTVSDTEVLRYIADIPEFQDEQGRFSEEIYKRALLRMGSNSGKFQVDIEQQLLLSKLMNVVEAAVQTPEGALKAAFEAESSEVVVRWVRIPDESLITGVPVDPAAAEAVVAGRASDIQKAYDTDPLGRYHKPQKAEVSTILLRTDLDQGKEDEALLRARLEKILAEARAGADFAQLARRHSEDLTAVNGGVQGLLAEPQMEPAMASAVFSAGSGKVTDIFQTARGLQIALVQSVTPAEVVPFDTAKTEIARELVARDGLASFAADFSTKVLERWKGDARVPEDLLAPYALAVETSPPSSPARPTLRGLGEVPGLTAALGKARAVGVVNQVFVADGARVLVEISSYTPADPTLFEGQRSMIRARLQYVEREAFTDRWKADLVKRAKVVYPS